MNFKIIQKGNKNTNKSSRKNIIPIAIAEHITGNTAKSAHNWFTSANNAVSSAHFIVTKKGEIWQYVDLKEMAWTTGLTSGIANASSELVHENYPENPNRYTVSIEHESTDGVLTDIQLQATIWLHKHIRQQIKKIYNHEMIFDRKHIIGHFEVDSKRKWYCPCNMNDKVLKFPFNKIINKLNNKKGDEQMGERVDIKIKTSGKIIEDCEKSTVDKLDAYLDSYEVVVDETRLYSYCGYILKKGMYNDPNNVLLQEALKELGHYNMDIDQHFGNGAHTAVVNLQSENGLSVNGEVNRATADKINDLLINKQNQPSAPTYENSINGLKPPKKEIKYGATGNEVRNLQIIYKMIGYDLGIDGSFGNECKGVTNDYKSKHNLPQDGVYDVYTHNLLIKETLNWKPVSYKSGSIYYVEVDKKELHGRTEKVDGYALDNILSNETAYLNATFRWYDSVTKEVYPQSAFVADGVVHANRCIENYGEPLWLGDKMPHLVIKKDGTVYTEVLNNIQSRLSETDFAVAGIQMYPEVNFVGFKASNISSLDYRTSRLAVAYNEVTDRIVFAYTSYMNIYDFASYIKAKGYTHTIGIDSGGSAQCDLGIIKRNTTRDMACWITFRKG